MIGKLTGRLDESGDGFAIIDVGGVGYHVFCSTRTLARIEPIEGNVTLWIETHVREDHFHLYGFAEQAEREWFRLLTTVQGVGNKVGLSILSALPTGELAAAIAAGDKASLGRAPGVGPKLAQRLVTELKDKVGGLTLGTSGKDLAAPSALAGAADDAVKALTGLGYRPMEASGAIAKAERALGAGASVEDLIRAGLKELAR